MLEFLTNKPQSKEQLMPLPHLWNTVCEKDCGLSTYKPWTEQAGGLDSILHEATQNFEVVSNIQ
jgi:hypothetical protein